MTGFAGRGIATTMATTRGAMARHHVARMLDISGGVQVGLTLTSQLGGTATMSGRCPAIDDHIDNGVYCGNPFSAEPIREAMQQSYGRGSKPSARAHVLSNSSWDRAAERLVEVYREAVS